MRALAKTNATVKNFMLSLISRRLEPESNKNIAAGGTVAVVRLDRVRKRIGGEVCSNAGLDVVGICQDPGCIPVCRLRCGT